MTTNEQIEHLATEAATAGDLTMAAIAYRALEWAHSLASTAIDAAERAKVEAMPVSAAWAACESAIREATAQRDAGAAKVARAAIEASVSTDGVARVDAGDAERAGVELDDVRFALLVECEDNTTGHGEHEYWGTTEDGSEWRVHVVLVRGEDA